MFGKYELLERINTGGMAETIKARDTGSPGRPIVAVKRVLPHLLQDEQYLTMFRDEARLLARLDHDNVIRTLEVGEVDGCPYAAIEYVHGQDARMLLHHARRGETKIPIRIGCYLVAQAALGLQHAHELCDEQGTALGLVHRDVSLQNILMSYDGAVKLIDFGIAMAAGNEDRTDTGIIKGKFGYMSPEQVRNEALDRRSDIFALGICLWELLVGERLFPGKNSSETLRRVREAEIESPRVRNPAIPDALEAITLRALSRHPRDRYQTAEDMRRALLAFMAESQNECGTSDLAQYVREVFAEELRKQPSPDVLVSEIARRFDEDSGLAAFDALDPVSTVSALHDQATDLEDGGGVLGSVPAPAPARVDPPSRSHVAGRPSVPPIVPRAASIPDGYLSWEDVMRRQGNARAVRVSAPAPVSEPRLRRVTPMPMRADPVSGERPVARQTPALEREVTPVRVAPRVEGSPPRRGPQGVVLVALVAAAAALGVGAVFALGRTAPATLQLATDPPDSIVTIDGARLAADRSPFLITDLAPRVTHEIRVSKEGHRDWSAKLVLQSGQTLTLPLVTLDPKSPKPPVAQVAAVEAPPAETAPAAPTPAVAAPKRPPASTTSSPARPPAAKGSGTLRINARPWAEVHVDGKYVGNTPQMALTLPAGAHVVRLTNPQFQLSKTVRIEIAAGETVTRVVALE